MLPPTGGLILCAVSGGRDSVCLLHYLHHLGQERGFAVAAAHLNHLMRPTAQRDEDFVRAFCRERGVEVISHDLPGRNDTVRLGLRAVGNMDGCLFCPGDQPLLRKETVEALVNAWRKESDFIWTISESAIPIWR